MKYVKWLMIGVYIYFILTKTIIGRTVMAEPILRGLFWEVQAGYWSDILMNILLFIPLGFLIGGWKGVAFGFALSCSIEVIQYFGRLGFCELDDVLNNTIGTCVGTIARIQIRKCYFTLKENTPRDE